MPRSALFWLGLVGLTATLFASRRSALIPAIVVGLVAFTFGADAVREQQEAVPGQAELDGGDAPRPCRRLHLLPPDRTSAVAPLLESIGHYPFDGSYHGDCGLVGQRLPLTSATSADEGRSRPLRCSTTVAVSE